MTVGAMKKKMLAAFVNHKLLYWTLHCFVYTRGAPNRHQAILFALADKHRAGYFPYKWPQHPCCLLKFPKRPSGGS